MIQLDSLKQLLAYGLEANVLREVCTVKAVRCTGHPNHDRASGLLTRFLETEHGVIEVCIPWEAEGQTRQENGWIVREAPHRNGAYVKTEIPVQGDEGVEDPTGDELSGVAFDYWSYEDLEQVEKALPKRTQEQDLVCP